MKLPDAELTKQTFIFAAINLLANRMQVLGDKIDPTVSLKQWFVLAAVSKFNKGPPNIGDIANLLGTSRQNIKKIANIMERRGFLRLEKDKNDLRSISIFLTEQCLDYFKGREQQENEFLENIFLGLDEDMLNTLCNGMGKLIENMNTLLEN